MGSSSAFCVGLQRAFAPYRTQYAVAESAIHIEREMMESTVGNQDQLACAMGGFNLMKFPGKNLFRVEENCIFNKLM